jgi:hypothetical protein
MPFFISGVPGPLILQSWFIAAWKAFVNGVDLDCQLFNGMIDETVRLCAKLNEPLQFQYQNGKHGIRLIKLPMSKSNRGTVTPKIKKCIDDMLSVFDDNDKDVADDVVVDTLLDYLLKSNRTKLMEISRERKMVPKVMDEGEEDMEDLDELAELETKMFGKIIDSIIS